LVDGAILNSIRSYLAELPARGIHASRAVLFGSYARGDANTWSDIDLVVIAPEFDGCRDLPLVQALWRARAQADVRIEPIACGEAEWETESARPIIEIAKREGILVAA
jgi:predicted nucleotidyltransferase